MRMRHAWSPGVIGRPPISTEQGRLLSRWQRPQVPPPPADPSSGQRRWPAPIALSRPRRCSAGHYVAARSGPHRHIAPTCGAHSAARLQRGRRDSSWSRAHRRRWREARARTLAAAGTAAGALLVVSPIASTERASWRKRRSSSLRVRWRWQCCSSDRETLMGWSGEPITCPPSTPSTARCSRKRVAACLDNVSRRLERRHPRLLGTHLSCLCAVSKYTMTPEHSQGAATASAHAVWARETCPVRCRWRASYKLR